jgi:hypothetical protein
MLALLLALSTPPDYLTLVQSPVYETPGAPPEIARRGETCMARLLASGRAGGQVIVSSDPHGGAVVATNAMEYRDGLLMWQMRSRVTLQARDGRFRIEHTSIERFNEQAGGWTPVGKWWGSGWVKAEDALKAVSASIAACVTGPAEGAGDDW